MRRVGCWASALRCRRRGRSIEWWWVSCSGSMFFPSFPSPSSDSCFLMSSHDDERTRGLLVFSLFSFLFLLSSFLFSLLSPRPFSHIGASDGPLCFSPSSSLSLSLSSLYMNGWMDDTPASSRFVSSRLSATYLTSCRHCRVGAAIFLLFGGDLV
ncbi:hypothetical protein BC567DRAFT_234001 [Phyllosticta citribraziliensis]